MELQTYFNEISSLIEKAKSKMLAQINKEIIDLYWDIGEYIHKKVKNDGWGKNTVKNLADHIKTHSPYLRGFSAQNLWRMKNFYETYHGNEKLSTLLREISWSNHLHIISKAKSMEEKEFYIRLCMKENYTARELERQIDSGYYERIMISGVTTLPVASIKDTSNALRDSYMLEFLDLPDDYKEKDLRKSIIKNLKKFFLELGKDFVLVGEEYRLQVGNNDYFIDLLLYNRELACLVAIELKITDFKPEYLGKVNFYLEALDRDVKKPHENPSVGIILCKSKDDDVVEYALGRSLSPTLIAEYRTKLIDKDVLRQKLHELFELGLLPEDG